MEKELKETIQKTRENEWEQSCISITWLSGDIREMSNRVSKTLRVGSRYWANDSLCRTLVRRKSISESLFSTLKVAGVASDRMWCGEEIKIISDTTVQVDSFQPYDRRVDWIISGLIERCEWDIAFLVPENTRSGTEGLVGNGVSSYLYHNTGLYS